MISKDEKIFISSISKQIKKSIKELVINHTFLDQYISLDDYCGACGIASYALFKRLKEHNINCSWSYGYHALQMYGEKHCWVNFKDRIIDVTYKQISNNSKNIYVSPVKYISVVSNPSHRVFNRFWSWQNPYKFNYDWQDNNLNISIKNF